MEAYSIQVISSGTVVGESLHYLEEGELFISISGHFCHIDKCMLLNSYELAREYLDAIKIKKRLSGDIEFDAEVVICESENKREENKYRKKIPEDSACMEDRLNRWKGTYFEELLRTMPH